MPQEFQKPFASPPAIFLVSLIIAIGIGLLWPWFILPWPVQLVLGPLIIFAGVRLVLRSIKDIETAGTTYDPYGISTALVTTGVYRHSRNPGYLGVAAVQFGLAVLLDNVWILVAGLVAAIVTTIFVIRLEERKLSDSFGDTYADYKKRVRRWL